MSIKQSVSKFFSFISTVPAIRDWLHVVAGENEWTADWEYQEIQTMEWGDEYKCWCFFGSVTFAESCEPSIYWDGMLPPGYE